MRIDQSEVLHYQKDRYYRHLIWNHQRRQQQHEEKLSTRKPQACERESRH